MNTKMIRVVLLGLGSVATETHNGGHLKQYINDPNIKVVSGIDPSPEARSRALQKGIPVVYPTFEDAVEKEEFDFVAILTPTKKHLECCHQVALSGKNILCEKPLASSLEEALAIQNIVKTSGISFLVNMNLRFVPIVQKIYEDINHGQFGQLFFLDFDECTSFKWTTYGKRKQENYSISSKSFWGNPKEYGLQRLIILDKVVHFIDLIRIWSGASITSVYVQGGCQGCHMDAGENISSIQMTLSNGLRCRLLNIWGSHFDDRAGGELSTRIRIFGDKGTAVYESYKKGAVGKYSIFENKTEVFTMEFPPAERKDFADSLKALANLVQQDEKDYKDLESAIEVMRVIEACYQSLEKNIIVNIAVAENNKG